MSPAREISPDTCAGCPAWLAPLLPSDAAPGKCLQRTVPMGEGCRLPRLRALGDAAACDTDPNWRD